MPPDLTATIGRLTLASPLIAAAGTVGYGVEFAPQLRGASLGALITKTVTVTPRPGHPPPRLAETPSGMLNCVGLQNVGIDAFVRDKWPAIRTLQLPVIVSLLGETLEEWRTLAQDVARLDGALAVELNLSCPNLLYGTSGARRPPLVAQDPDATRIVLQTVRSLTPLPLLAKLSPDVTDIAPLVEAAAAGGADAVVIGNTFSGMAIDVVTRRSKVSQRTGGVSGPAIRPLMLRRVWEVAQLRRVPVIGAGGVLTADDAIEYLLAGACAVEVGTAHFAQPRAIRRIAAGLTAYLNRHKMARIADLVGALV